MRPVESSLIDKAAEAINILSHDDLLTVAKAIRIMYDSPAFNPSTSINELLIAKEKAALLRTRKGLNK